MPDCYALVNLNPRDSSYAREVANAIAETVGAAPDASIIRYDEARRKAHVFVPLKNEEQIAAVIARLKELEAILDYAVVALPSEVGVRDVTDYPSGAEST